MVENTPATPEGPDGSADRESHLIEQARRQVYTRSGGEEDVPRFTAATDDLGGMPARIGPYRIKRFLSSGGMARVYEAEQGNPRRRVAIKVIRARELSEKALRRFEYETRLLARLRHPGIARIYEVGSFHSPLGRHPFFSMEFVDGTSLTEFASRQRLDHRERLRLMMKVCDAVEHAHLKGIVHRDLKPANIIVDDKGQPKVLDFGVARAVDPDLQATTMLTRLGEPVGTIPYMSPEQVSGNPDDIDARCDVYSLGVVCYELLTGRLPYDLHAKPRAEAFRIICEQEPLPLSSISRTYRGDVETIVAKALEKTPGERYQSVREFAQDIERYLNDEPIRARRVGRVGRFMRWCRRQPLAAGLSAVSLGLLVALAVGSTVAALTIEEARQRAAVLAEQRRRSLYAAQMNLALQAFDRNEFATVRTLLEANTPERGQNDLRSFLWRYLWRQMHGEARSLPHDGIPLRCVAFSPDGSLLASCGQTGHVTLWDTDSWSPKADLAAHDGAVTDVKFSPDGQTLAAVGKDGRVTLWDTSAAVSIADWHEHREPVQCVAFSPDGRLLVTGAGRLNTLSPEHRAPAEVILWDCAGGKPRWIKRFSENASAAGPIIDVAFSPDGRTLAIVPWGHPGSLWDTETGEPLTTLPDEPAPAMEVEFSPGGHVLAVGGWGKRAVLWDVHQRATICTLQDRGIRAIAFSPDGSRVITSNNNDARISIWDAKTGTLLDQLTGHIGWVRGLSVSPDGRQLASAGSDGIVKIWDLEKQHQPRVLKAHDAEMRAIAFSPDGKLLASGDNNRLVKLWNPETGQHLMTLQPEKGNWINSLSFSPDARTLAVAAIPTLEVVIYDVTNGAEVIRLAGLGGPPSSVAYSPKGRYLATGTAPDPSRSRGAVKLWETVTWKVRWTALGAHGKPGVRIVCFAPDERTLASGGLDGTIKTWDVETGKLQATLEHVDLVSSVQYSPDGSLLAAGCERRSPGSGPQAVVKLWDTRTGELKHSLPGHKQAVYGLSFSPDGRTLATGGGLGDVKLWDPVSGEEKGSFKLPKHGWTFGVAFSPDGRRLAVTNGSATEPGDIWLFEAADPDRVE